MYLLSHGQRILYAIVKILLVCNGIEKGTNFPIRINLPLLFICSIIFVIVVEIDIIPDICYLLRWWNTYNYQVKSVWIFREKTSKIETWQPLQEFRIGYCKRKMTPNLLSKNSYQ